MILLSVLACFGSTQAPPEEAPPLQLDPPKPRLDIGVTPAPTKPGDPEPGLLEAQCSDLQDGGEVQGPGCLTSKITCGEVVIGHTRGGTDRYDTRFYEQNRCTPATTDHDGGDERAYLLEMPPGERRALVWLDTPCADLDLAAVLLPMDQEACPEGDAQVPRCEMRRRKGTEREHLELVTQSKSPSRWLLLVEGVDDHEGAFSLTVQCAEGRF